MKKLIGIAAVVFLAGQVFATALTEERNTPARSGGRLSLGVYTNVQIYAGAMVCVNSSGYAVPAADTAGYAVIGRARSSVDARLQISGVKTIEIDRGVFRWENADTIVDADIGKIVYVTDDATVNKTGGGQNIIAGAVVDVDDDGVWVDTGKIGPIGAATPSSLACSGAATIGTTLTVSGATSILGALTCGSTLSSTGLVTCIGGLTVTEDVAVTLDATDEEVAITTSSGAAKVVRVYCSSSNPTTTALLELDYLADGDADGSFLVCKDNSSGDTKFSVGPAGDTTVAGTLTVTGQESLQGRAATVAPSTTTVMLQSGGGAAVTNGATVTFSPVFTSVPKVVMGYAEASTITNCYPSSVASNGFTVVGEVGKTCNWIAHGNM